VTARNERPLSALVVDLQRPTQLVDRRSGHVEVVGSCERRKEGVLVSSTKAGRRVRFLRSRKGELDSLRELGGSRSITPSPSESP